MSERETMTTYDFVHLVMYAADGTVKGRTKLQKLVYFAGALTGKLDDLGYRAHYYGPYSAEVAGAVDDLRGLGFLEQKVISGCAVDTKGFEIARYDYSLTSDGKLVAEEKVAANREEWESIQNTVKRLEKAKADDYVKLSLAAKAYFVARQRSERFTVEELVCLMPSFSWKVTEEQMREAGKWLEDLKIFENQNDQRLATDRRQSLELRARPAR
jgi:uncharacterized protein YwgA